MPPPRDELLSPQEEKRWRQALELMGRDRIDILLRRYPGEPDDPVTDLPLQPPFPTREFCRQWCLKTSSRAARGYASLLVAMALLGTLAVSYAACSLSPFNVPTNQPGPTAAATGAGGMGGRNANGPASSVQTPTTSATPSSSSKPMQPSPGMPAMPNNTAPPQVPGTYQVQGGTAGSSH